MQVPEDLAAILHDQDLFSNPEGLTTKDILKRCEKFVSLKKDNSSNNNDNFGEGSSSGNRDVRDLRHNLQHQTYIEQGNNENQNANSTNIYPASSSIVNNESSIPVEQRAS